MTLLPNACVYALMEMPVQSSSEMIKPATITTQQRSLPPMTYSSVGRIMPSTPPPVEFCTPAFHATANCLKNCEM